MYVTDLCILYYSETAMTSKQQQNIKRAAYFFQYILPLVSFIHHKSVLKINNSEWENP